MFKRLSNYQKYRLCQGIFATGFIGLLICLSRMSAFGSSKHNKLVFTALIIILVVTIPFACGFYYYRPKKDEIPNL